MKHRIAGKIRIISAAAAAICAIPCAAGEADSGSTRLLTLEECRELAAANNISLKEAGKKIEIAGYDRKIAMANYFPNITATASYQFNSRDLKILGKDETEAVTNAGNTVQDIFSGQLDKIMSDPLLGTVISVSPKLKELFSQLAATDIASPLNAIGSGIDEALTLHIQNIYLGAVSLQQPVFMGGKIIAANRMASLAEDLAREGYDMALSETTSEVEQAYWQTVSVAGKKRLAEGYAELLHQMESDIQVMVREGVATQADELSVRVKANEADMLLTKASNGLVISKMLLCRLCGLDLDTDITLADEDMERIPVPQFLPEKSDEEIFADRPEIRSLELASQIYDRKTAMARADMMPKVALTANYLISNPNMYHGFRNEFGGMFNAGISVSIPIVHGCGALHKVQKAKAEAVLTRYRLEDAREMVTLQVCRLRQERSEAMERFSMAENNLSSAEENLRAATIGFNEGVIPPNTALAAHTAWLQAQSEYIDAGVDLQLTSLNLDRAEGR